MEVCRFANVLKKHGVKKGDRVTMYLQIVITSYSIHYTKLYDLLIELLVELWFGLLALFGRKKTKPDGDRPDQPAD